MSDENTSAAEEVVADATPSGDGSSAEAAPASTPEPRPSTFEPPSWINEFEDDKPETSAAPVTSARTNTPTDDRWSPPTFDRDLLERDGDKYMQWYMRAWLGPVAQAQLSDREKLRLIEEEATKPRIHPALADQALASGQKAVVSHLQRFTLNPLYADPKVRNRVDNYFKGALKEARKAAREGDFQPIRALENKNLADAMFWYMAAEAGYPNGQAPASVATPETTLETPKAQKAGKTRSLTAEQEEMYAHAKARSGISRAEFIKLLDEDEAYDIASGR